MGFTQPHPGTINTVAIKFLLMKTTLRTTNCAFFSLKDYFKVGLLLLLLLPTWLVHAKADLVLSPATPTVNVGDNFSITLQVQTGTQEVDGIEAYLDFNPAFVTVNSVVYNAGSQLPTVITNNFNQSLGQINVATGLFGGGFVTGTFDYITINLTAAVAGATSIDFSFDPGPPNRKTEISRIGASVLGATAGATITIIDPNANTPPTVSITAPAGGAVFNQGDNVVISATANDTDGSVSSVAFFDGAIPLGTDNTAPYSVNLSNI